MSDSNNITVLNPGLYKNLLAQVEAIYKHSNELSFKTRARYFEATKRFCKFLYSPGFNTVILLESDIANRLLS